MRNMEDMKKINKGELKQISTILWQGTVVNTKIKTAIGINNSLENLYYNQYRISVKELKR